MNSAYFAALLVLAACAPCSLVAQTTATPPQPTTIEGATTHVYKTVHGHELRLHVFAPEPYEAAPARAAIVFFFGGGWLAGDIREFVPQARYLARRGMTAIVADYRVFNRHGTSAFDAMTDAKSALRWVRSHAAELGIDPDRIAAGGGSAGGHLALAAVIFDGFDDPAEAQEISAKPNALVLFDPVVDASAEPFNARFSGRGLEGSPLRHDVRFLPPTIILHGLSDKTVPYADVERFCTRARDRGLPCKLVAYPGAGHTFFHQDVAGGKWYRATLLEVDRFLTRLGYLRPRGDR
jgi:acetyl esterase